MEPIPNTSPIQPVEPPTSTMPTAPLQKIDGPVALLRSGWKLLTRHWKVLLPILLIPSIITYIGNLLGYAHNIALSLIGTIISIAGAVISVAMVPAIVNAIHRISTESTPSISLKSQYKLGFRYFWALILVGIINFLVGLGSVFFLVIPAIIMGVYACMYVYTLVIDDKRGFSVMTESFSLVRGRWWPVLGRMLFLGLVLGIVWLILAGAGFLIGLATGVPFPALSRPNIVSEGTAAYFLISSTISLIGTAIMGPIAIGYTYKMYLSLKEKRQANVSTSAFKKWLVTFLVIGIVGIALVLVTVPLVVVSSLSSARTKAQEALNNAVSHQAEIGKIIQDSIGSTSPQAQ